jgi:hypothetical protein
MHIAACLLAIVLVTSSIIGTTFAKYVTAESGTDSARVAKWGITISATGNLFSNQYVNKDNGNEAGTTNLTIKSTENVVAPGSQNTTGLTIGVTGTPEVDYTIAVENNTTTKDVFLKAGTYKVGDEEYTITTDYYPIKYTVNDGTNSTSNITLAQAITNISTGLNTNNTVGTETNKSYKLTWTWTFDDNDVADTVLGYLAAGTTVTKMNGTTASEITSSDYNLSTNFDITVRATQVD